ncbi:hypothetical protein ACO2Q8_05825 [Larkinella sp. VNQ87]|uniref:hypothetical protein n=1 Tax=Larkinella sp. VNQ87 TaxID=3400921 RepID=UPI003C0AA3A6
MSQHPIDDLFADKLRNHGLKPERASWDELQRRINAKAERRASIVWWYASVASVAVVLLASWWLWSGNNGDKTVQTGPAIARQTPPKPMPAQKESLSPAETDILPEQNKALAYQKPTTYRSGNVSPQKISKPIQPISDQPEELAAVEMPQKPVSEELAKPDTRFANVKTQEPERTLVVQIATPKLETKESVAVMESGTTSFDESEEEQPRKKRFRIGRVFRQITKLKAGEPVEWEEVGVKPVALFARASEKVQEGKEKLTESYENLRYNTFRKNANNK